MKLKSLTFCVSMILLIPNYIIGQQWTILETYTIPGKASGLAYDGTYLYSGIYGSNGDEVYQINPSDGTYTLQFSDPNLGDSFGMTYGGGNLWITDHHTGVSDPAIAYEYSLSGTVLSQFNLPDHYMSGIAYDNGNFWVATYYISGGSEIIYKVDSTGSVLSSFAAPDAQPWAVCLENEDMWVVDYNANTLFKVDTTDGSILDSHVSENIKPAGVVFDGQYLWYVDGGLSAPSTLYKVDLGGGGTPVVSINIDHYDFGNVIIGNSAESNLTLSNTGTGDLTINSITITNTLFSTDVTLPQIIQPGGSLNIPLTFSPNNIGPTESTLTVECNDPINPQVQVELQGYGIEPDADIAVDYTFMDFNNVRVGAQTSKTLSISNQGASDLTITANNNQFVFTLDETLNFPMTLSTRDTVILRCWFSPPTLGEYSGAMVITSDDPDESIVNIVLHGIGIQFNPDIGTVFWHLTSNVEGEKIIAFRNFVDLNNDGVDEVLVADNDYHVHCVNGNSSGEADILWTFSSQLGSYWTGSIYQEPGLKVGGDLNADGIADVLVGTAWGSRSVFALDGSNGNILWYFDSHTIGDGGWVYEVDGNNDFTSDGIPDILACAGDDGGGTGPKRVWLFDGTNGNLVWQHLFDVAIASVISIEDATNDGVPEVVCGESVNTGTAEVHLLNGSNGNVIYSWDSNSSAVMALSTISDGNGDGREDFCYGDYQGDIVAYSSVNTLLWSASLGSGILTHFDNLSSNLGEFILPSILGNYTFPVINTSNGSYQWTIAPGGYTLDSAPVADINGDETNDVLIGIYDNSGGNHKVIAASGTDGQTIYETYPGSAVEQVMAIDDLDGNGSSEIVYGLRNGNVYCISGGTNGTQPNQVPVITNISLDPPNPYTSDPVTISATITDDHGIISATCYWEYGTIANPTAIPMIPSTSPDVYSTVTPIPEDTLGLDVYYYIVAQDAIDSTTSPTMVYSITDTTVAIIAENNQLPQHFKIHQNYPNPFNPTTTLNYDLPEKSFVTIVIFDVLGRMTKTLSNNVVDAGYHSITWDGTDRIGNQVGAGVYFYQIRSGEFVQTKKMLLIK